MSFVAPRLAHSAECCLTGVQQAAVHNNAELLIDAMGLRYFVALGRAQQQKLAQAALPAAALARRLSCSHVHMQAARRGSQAVRGGVASAGRTQCSLIRWDETWGAVSRFCPVKIERARWPQAPCLTCLIRLLQPGAGGDTSERSGGSSSAPPSHQSCPEAPLRTETQRSHPPAEPLQLCRAGSHSSLGQVGRGRNYDGGEQLGRGRSHSGSEQRGRDGSHGGEQEPCRQPPAEPLQQPWASSQGDGQPRRGVSHGGKQLASTAGATTIRLHRHTQSEPEAAAAGMSLQAADLEAPAGPTAEAPGPDLEPEQDALDDLLGPDVRVLDGALLSGSEAALQLQSSAAFSAEALQWEGSGSQPDRGPPGEEARHVCCTWLRRLASNSAWSWFIPFHLQRHTGTYHFMPVSSVLCCLLASHPLQIGHNSWL